MKNHNVTPKTTEKRRPALKEIAIGTLAATSLLGGAPAEAAANKTERTKQISSQVKEKLFNNGVFTMYRGTIVIKRQAETGGIEAAPTRSGGESYPNGQAESDQYVQFPLVKFGGKHNSTTGIETIRNGDYFTYIDRDDYEPHTERFNNTTMGVVVINPEMPELQRISFPLGKTGLPLLENAVTSSDGRPDLHGGPVTDVAGNPLQVAVAFTAQK